MANPFKKALLGATPQIGLWLSLGNAYAAEACAGAGFDWLLIDGEHAPNDVRSTLAQLQAVAPYTAHPIVRPPIGETWMIKQLLDIGAQTLLIPMVDTAEQARELVRAMRYPPEGVRGVGSGFARASRFGGIPDYLTRANSEVCLLVQVETRAGLDNLEAIAQVDGVDGVFIGPSDLSASLGHLGDPSHPDVLAAIHAAIDTVIAAGKAAGILATRPEFAQDCLARGCRFVAVGADVGLLTQGARALKQAYRK
nr:4-hydroxy-2-oxoheptanedioate aldolase [Pseudomonas sp.]